MAASLAGIIGGIGLGMTPRPQTQLTPVMVKQEPVQKIESTPTQEQKPTEVKKEFQFSHPTIEKFLGAISKAEHRGTKDINHRVHDPRTAIRTKGGGGSSSAWGSYQLTRNTVADHFKRKPHLFKGNEQYVNDFINQGTRFLKAKTNDPQFGLGAPGSLSGSEHHENYMRMADSVAQSMMGDTKINHTDGISDSELQSAIQRWRGVPSDKDETYYKIVNKSFKS